MRTWLLAAFLVPTIVTLTLSSPALWAQSYSESYVGAQRCGSCHPFALQMWQAGPHAKAHERLSPEQAQDAKCNTCHTMIPGVEDARFVGVQCERCHGPGKYYHPSFVMKDRELARAVGLVEPGEKVCRQCHTEGAPSIEPFDFDAMWARIDHGKAARLRWEESRKASTDAAPQRSPQK